MNPSNITISNTIDGANPLTLTSGLGDITLSGTLGETTPLASLTFTGEDIFIASIGGISAGVSGTTNITALENINFTGTTYNANTQTYTAGQEININSGTTTTISSGGNPLTFQGNEIFLSATSNLTLDSSGGTLTSSSIQATTGSLRSLVVTGGSGAVQIGAVGFEGGSEFTSASISGSSVTLAGGSIANSITLNPTSTLFVKGRITTTNTPLNFPTAVEIQSGDTFSTGGGNITFASTIDANIDNTEAFFLSAGTGNITFSGAIGNTNRINIFDITSANNVTVNTIRVTDLLQTNGTGTTQFNGQVTTNLTDIATGNILFNAPINTVDATFVSTQSMANVGTPFAITSNSVSFNALNGNIGSVASPLLVNSSGEIFAGGVDLAVFDGSSIDDTIIPISSNDPCVIIFNGITIQDCGISPTPPTPTSAPPPSGSSN